MFPTFVIHISQIMKNLLLPLLALCCVSLSFSQIGINTTEPSATLDVNGTIRVRNFMPNYGVEATKIIGIDEEGNFVEVVVGENIILDHNELRVVENRYHTAVIPTINDGVVDNLDMLILPGEPNDDKKIMRIVTSGSALNITGIKAGEDGQMIWLMSYTDRVKILPLDVGSDPENQFLINNAITIFQYEMIQLVYDATLQKWLLMAN